MRRFFGLLLALVFLFSAPAAAAETDTLMLVNKEYFLAADYAPGGLSLVRRMICLR